MTLSHAILKMIITVDIRCHIPLEVQKKKKKTAVKFEF